METKDTRRKIFFELGLQSNIEYNETLFEEFDSNYKESLAVLDKLIKIFDKKSIDVTCTSIILLIDAVEKEYGVSLREIIANQTNSTGKNILTG